MGFALLWRSRSVASENRWLTTFKRCTARWTESVVPRSCSHSISRSIDSSANRAAQAVAKIAPTGLVSPKGVTLVRSLDGKVRDLRGRFVALGGAVGKAGARTDGFVNGALNAYELLKRSSAIGTMFSAVSGAASVGVDAVGRFISTTVELNSAVESTRIAVAGMLQVGGATGSWAESMQVAESVMQRIRVHAAALPGEADDLVADLPDGPPESA